MVETPQRLRKSIEMESWKQTVKYYKLTDKLFKRYQSIQSFKLIHQECQSISQQLIKILQTKISEPQVKKKNTKY